MKNQVCEIVKIVNNQGNLMDAYLHTGCISMLEVIHEVTQDIESSLFLAIHGRYGPALALLRRWLETSLIALYFDAELKKHAKGSRTYKYISQKRERWIEKSDRLKFTGEYGILERLIDPDTDFVAVEILKKTKSKFTNPSFKKYINKLYSRLSKFVHYGGISQTEKFPTIDFAEFKEDSFKEWYTRYQQVYEICNLTTAIKFPEILQAYDKTQKNLPPYDEVQFLTYQQTQELKQLLAVGEQKIPSA